MVIGDSIGVTAHFEKAVLRPLQLLWGGQKIRIAKITGRWKSAVKGCEIINLSVVSENGTYYEISFNTKTLIWVLEKVETE